MGPMGPWALAQNWRQGPGTGPGTAANFGPGPGPMGPGPGPMGPMGRVQNIFKIFSKYFLEKKRRCFPNIWLKINEYIFPVFQKSRVFARNGSRIKMARSYHRQIS